MIVLDQNADTFPVGLAGTPFEEVYRALRIVAATVWDVDPLAYRAGMAWGWYALHDPAALVGFRDVVTAALISEIAPMVKDTQTDAELVEYLRQWRSYTPTFPKLQAIYALFGVVVDVQPISDPEGQALLPVDDTRLAFYIFVLSMDWARPMLLGEIAETARRASPLGARPFVVYLVEGFVSVPVAIAPTDGFLWVDVWESAVPVVPPGPTLPTVSMSGDFGTDNLCRLGTSVQNIDSGQTKILYDSQGNYIYFDATKLFAVVWWQEQQGIVAGRTEFSLVRYGGPWTGLKNDTQSTLRVLYVKLAVCSSNLATVITVYDTSNVAYNAFKFTASGTDYYYVLDGTQTDWTDDLANIGYRLDMQFYFYFKMSNYSPLDETFDYPSSDNYWTLRVRDQTDADSLSALGLRVNSSYQDGPFGFLKYDTSIYSYELKAILLPDGSSATFNISDFYITAYSGSMAAQLWCTGSYSTPVRSCLISIKPIS